MSGSAALEFTIDKQISKTFLVYQLRKIYGSKRPGYLFVYCEFQCCTPSLNNSNLDERIIQLW